MGTEDTKKAAGLVELLEQPSLPVAVRGYDRAATDRLHAQVLEGLRVVLQQHAAALSRARDLERRLTEGQEREEAVTEALVVATQIRAESEREGREIKAKYAREGEAVVDEARQKAEGIVRDAELEAERIVDGARQKVRGFEQQIRDAEQLAVDARARVTSFLESLLLEVGEPGDQGSPADDLLARSAVVTADAGAAHLPVRVDGT
jgi:cell division septum initiation protein DivIVA